MALWQILIAALLSIPMGMVAIALYENKWIPYVESRKIKIDRKRKEKALREYYRIKKYVESTNNEMIIRLLSSVHWTIITMGFGVIIIITAYLLQIRVSVSDVREGTISSLIDEALLFNFVSAFGFAVVIFTVYRFNRTQRRIQRYLQFDNYTAEIEKAFGAEVVANYRPDQSPPPE